MKISRADSVNEFTKFAITACLFFMASTVVILTFISAALFFGSLL